MPDISALRAEIDAIDRQMALLFAQRMEAAAQIARQKAAAGLPARDIAREQEILQQNLPYIIDPALHSFYADFLQQLLATSRAYQQAARTADGEG